LAWPELKIAVAVKRREDAHRLVAALCRFVPASVVTGGTGAGPGGGSRVGEPNRYCPGGRRWLGQRLRAGLREQAYRRSQEYSPNRRPARLPGVRLPQRVRQVA
jgi:hypothetical protein